MPSITLTVSNDVASRLANAAVLENPSLQNATGSEKAEYVRQKIILMLKNWVVLTERNNLKSSAFAQLNTLSQQLQQIEQQPIIEPEVI